MDDQNEGMGGQPTPPEPVKFECPDLSPHGEMLLWRGGFEGHFVKFRWGFFITANEGEIAELRLHDPTQTENAKTPYVYETTMDANELFHDPTQSVIPPPQE